MEVTAEGEVSARRPADQMLLVCCTPFDLPGGEASVMDLIGNETGCAIIELDLKLGRR